MLHEGQKKLVRNEEKRKGMGGGGAAFQIKGQGEI